MKAFRSLIFFTIVLTLLTTACGGATPTPEVVKETVVITEKETEVVIETQVVVETEIVEVEVTPTPEGAPIKTEEMGEASMLAERVAAGELPSVNERLPETPAQMRDVRPENVEVEIGKYGGTLVLQDANPPGHQGHIFDEQMLLCPGIDIDLATLEGNVLQDYEVSSDNKTFTFYMREGLKWSDGEPVTTEDVRFWWEDVINNEELTAAVPQRFTRGGEPMDLEIIDEYTYEITFAEPYGAFLVEYGKRWDRWSSFMLPSHYLKQWHTDYTPLEDLAAEIEAEGFAEGEWWNLFNLRLTQRPEPDDQLGPPTLAPWVQVERTTTEVLYERNPYYWKVDAEGNQLPYLDYLRFLVVADPQAQLLNLTSGDVDFERTGMANVGLVLDNQHVNDMKVIIMNENSSTNDMFINLTYDDPVWREVVRDVRFRQALNYAYPRPDINLFYEGNVAQGGWYPDEFDLEKAEALLDEVLPEKDAEGWRLGPDGQRFVVPIEYGPWIAARWSKVADLIVANYQSIGLYTTAKQLEGGYWEELCNANQLKATLMWSHPRLWPFIEPDWMMGFGGGLARCTAVQLWREWVESGGEQGEEPEQWYQDLWNIYTAMQEDLKNKELYWPDEVQRIYNEQIPFFQAFYARKNPLIAKEGLGNVPFAGVVLEGNFAVEQWFWK